MCWALGPPSQSRNKSKKKFERLVWAYWSCYFESETTLKMRSYIWRQLEYFWHHFACWCCGESSQPEGGIWGFGVLLHLRRFNSVTSNSTEKPWATGCNRVYKEQWGEQRCPLHFTKWQGSQGFIAAMERAIQRGQPPLQPGPKFLCFCSCLIPGSLLAALRIFSWLLFLFLQSRLSNEECVKSCGSRVDSSGCPLPAEYAESSHTIRVAQGSWLR